MTQRAAILHVMVTHGDVAVALCERYRLQVATDIESHWSTRVRDERGWGFLVGENFNVGPNRIEVVPLMPPRLNGFGRSAFYNAVPARITVSKKRTTDAILRDVQRKQETAYNAAFDAALVAHEAGEQRKRRERRHRDEIGDILPNSRNMESHSGRSVSHFSVGKRFPDSWSGSFQAYPEAVDVELHRLPPDLALAIARTIADYAAAG